MEVADGQWDLCLVKARPHKSCFSSSMLQALRGFVAFPALHPLHSSVEFLSSAPQQ